MRPSINTLEKYIKENERVTNITASAMDESWTERIQSVAGPVLVIVERLSRYLAETDVKQILSIIDRHFPQVTVFMEILNPKFVKKNVEKSIQQSGAVFTWGARSGEELPKPCQAFRWQGDRSLVEGMVEIAPIYKIIGKIGAIRNLSNKIVVLTKDCKR